MTIVVEVTKLGATCVRSCVYVSDVRVCGVYILVCRCMRVRVVYVFPCRRAFVLGCVG